MAGNEELVKQAVDKIINTLDKPEVSVDFPIPVLFAGLGIAGAAGAVGYLIASKIHEKISADKIVDRENRFVWKLSDNLKWMMEHNEAGETGTAEV